MKTRIFVVLASLLLTAGMCFGQSATKDSAQNPGFPRVVARLNLFNRTKAIGPQTLYTPTASGVFRASVYMANTLSNDSSGQWSTIANIMNELGPQEVQVGYVLTNAVQGFSGSAIFAVTKSTPIALSVTSRFDTSGSQYNAYIILEQLE